MRCWAVGNLGIRLRPALHAYGVVARDPFFTAIRKTIMKVIVSALLGGSLLLVSSAGICADERHQMVSYADLNLASARGQMAFNRRVSAAATAVCGDIYSRDLAESGAARRCRNLALLTANPMITAAIARKGAAQIAMVR